MTISVHERRAATLCTPSNLSGNAERGLVASLTGLLTDCFAL
jgi:hypothetical protein